MEDEGQEEEGACDNDWERGWGGRARGGEFAHSVRVRGGADGDLRRQARTLLQSIVTSTTAEVAQTILGALLARITTPDKAESAWSGHVQGVKGSEIPAALWELISRRWLTVFEWVVVLRSIVGRC